VSFTHIIGYALVKALKAMPEMNNGFEESTASRRSSSPPTSTSASPSTCQDGRHPPAAGALDQGRRDMDFAAFWTAYEDVVRKARDNKLHGRRLPGHHDHAHQPRAPSAPTTRCRG
jgi:2-oxoglutarate dehydrogenase E1 component